MGISTKVSNAIAALTRLFVGGGISEKKFKRREEALVTFGNGEWSEPVRRPAAASSGSRQNRRREELLTAFRRITSKYPGEARAVRRRMARGIMRNQRAAAAAA